MKEKPEATKGDLLHTGVRAVLGAIPYVGSVATELFSQIVTPPLTKRRDDWIESIAKDLTSLEAKIDGFKLVRLSNNESFLTTALHATQAALRTHQREKLDALRNAILNVAINRAPDDDLQLIFLTLVDSFTPWHLRILRYFDDHPTQAKSGYESGDLFKIYPELEGKALFYEQIVRDLNLHGLVTSNVTPGTYTAFMPFAGKATELGKNFLAFITSPI